MKNLAKAIRRSANIVAMEEGYGKAAFIISGDKNEVVEHIRHGYRKYTSGEYVPNAYRRKFGWKNTYYQPATTTVELVNLIEQFVDFESFLNLKHLHFRKI